MRKLAVISGKGGVGKSTWTINTADALAQQGKRVLVVDLDPTARTSSIQLAARDEPGISDVLYTGEPGCIAEAITPSGWAGIDVVGTGQRLADRESDNQPGGEVRLRVAMEGLEGYDVALFDCRPTLGPLTANALVAADAAIWVTDADVGALDTGPEVLQALRFVQTRLNPGLHLAGIVVNRMSNGTEYARCVADLDEAFPDLVLRPLIPASVRVGESRGEHLPVRELRGRPRAMGMADCFAAIARQVAA